MKRYLSSLLVLTLFLSNFSVFAMQNKAVQVSQKTEEKKFGQLPDDVIFYVIVPFLDGKTLANMRFANKDYNKKLNEFVVFVYLKDFQSGWIKRQIAYNVLNFAGIRNLRTKMQEKIQKRGSVRLCVDDSRLRVINGKILPGTISCYNPEVAQAYDMDLEHLGPCLGQEFFYERPQLLDLGRLVVEDSVKILLGLGFLFATTSILHRIGIKRPKWLRFNIFSACENSGKLRKFVSTVVNFSASVIGNLGIVAATTFVSYKIGMGNLFANRPRVRTIARSAKLYGLRGMVYGGIQGAIKNGLYGVPKGLMRGAATGILVGGVMGVCSFSILPFGVTCAMNGVVRLRNGLEGRYNEDTKELLRASFGEEKWQEIQAEIERQNRERQNR